MPTERFNRLPEEKRSMILDAAKKEFARVPFEKASINQIIKNADISRGSFYTYFEDKQDVVKCIFEETQGQMELLCKETLEESHGDYIAMLKQLFEYFVAEIQQTTDMLSLVKNVFSYQGNRKIFGLVPETRGSKIEEDRLVWMLSKVNEKMLRFHDLQHFRAMLGLGVAGLLMSIQQYYEHPENLDQVRSDYHIILEVLRCGAYQEEFQKLNQK